MEIEKSTAVEDSFFKEKHTRDDGCGEQVLGKRPKIEDPFKNILDEAQQARLQAYYKDFSDNLRSLCSDSKFARTILVLVPKDSEIESLLRSIMYRMRIKSFEIADLIKANSPLRVHHPYEMRTRNINVNLFRGVSDEELREELQSAVDQNSSVLGESCVNSVAKLLGRFQDICTRLKDLEATAESRKEELESKGFIDLDFSY